MKPNVEHRIRQLERQIQDEPNNPGVYVDLARCYSSVDELAQAVRYLEKAKQLDPYHVQASFELGVTYSRQASFDSAVREWEKMIDSDGDLDLDTAERTRFSAIRAAAEAWRLYRQNREDNVFKFYNLGIAAMALGGLEDARKAFETVVNMNPAFEKAAYYLARVQHKRKDLGFAQGFD